MTFADNEKLKALAIVNIFETSQPFGDYAACVVLNDGAGVSYGISQFTHRSGSLCAVVESYLNNGGKIAATVLTAALPGLKKTSAAALKKLSDDERFKNALRAAAVTREMKMAQHEIAFKRYLKPALEICEERNFSWPLSLAVVYDSINHGSWKKIGRNVVADAEKAWILEYIRRRHNWLCGIPRLKATSYRTQFFLNQIAIGNWDLRLPVVVNGFRLTEAILASEASVDDADPEPQRREDAEKSILASAAEKFDRVEKVVTGVTTRADSAKSMWTTVIGTIWQPVWAFFSFLLGLPNEVWIVVAVIAAILMLAYLYRQIELGRIRETKEEIERG